MPHIVSVQVGLPRSLGVEGATNPMERPWKTGFFKEPVLTPVWVGRTNLVGDGQADLKHHGGTEKAVLAYAAQHYLDWRQKLSLPNLPFGAFGENLTVADQAEDAVCIGDLYRLGSVHLQVSQPRQPCWKLARRWRIRDLALQVQNTGQTGWYFRVIQEGYIEPGLPVELCDRPYPQWTVARANDIMHRKQGDRDVTAQLAACPLLANNWQKTLKRRAETGTDADPASRLWGQNQP